MSEPQGNDSTPTLDLSPTGRAAKGPPAPPADSALGDTLALPPAEGGKSVLPEPAPTLPEPTFVLDPEGSAPHADKPNAEDLETIAADPSASELTPAAPGPEADPEATLDVVPDPTTIVPTGRATRFWRNDAAPSSSREARAAGHAARRTVAGYELLGELGRGGMGVVYKARQLGLNRFVALKMVIAGAHASELQLNRFYSEAEAVAGLQHPNIVQIFDVGKHGDLPYFSLEYVDGGSLAQKLDGKPQPPQEAARLLEAMARGVACAHQRGIIHRDLKPANVLLTRDGVPKITDFGLAKRLESDSSQTKSGTLMGTPNYMAPEQAAGRTRDVGPHSDVYALGAILYEMLTGRAPLVGTTVIETLELVQKREPLPLSWLRPGVPRDLETICLKCLQKEPAKRYAGAEALADDLRRFLAGEPIQARRVSRAERAWRWCRRNPRVAALTSVALLLLLTAGAAVSALAVTRAREKAAEARRRDDQQKAIDQTRQLAREKLDQATEAVKAGDHKRALDLLGWSTPLMETAPELDDVRGEWNTLRSQVEVFGEFKSGLDNVRFDSRFGSDQLKRQAQQNCRKLIRLDEEIRQRSGRGSAGLPPLSPDQERFFQEDVFEAYLIAALLETDLARGADAEAKKAAARRAIDWLNSADKILPNMRVVYANRAPCWGMVGEEEKDQADLERAKGIVPASAVDHFWHGFAHHLRANEARNKGDLKGAQEFYRQEVAEYAMVLQQRPDHFWSYFNWANCQAEQGNLRDALVGYTACIRIRPDFPWPYNNRGTIHLNLGEKGLALQDYDAALARNGEYVEAIANRAEAYRGLKQFEKAAADYTKLLERTADKGPVYLKLASVHNDMGRPGDAVADCTRALDLNPKNAQALYARGGFEVARKEYRRAREDYTAVLALVPRALEPRRDRANLDLLFLKDFDASLADFEELAKLRPKNPEPLFGQGVIHLGRREYDEAGTALRRAVALKPDHAESVWALAQVVAWQGDLKEALNLVNRVAEKLPADRPETLNVRGDIYRALGRLDDAAADYNRLIGLKPHLVETYVSLAMVYEKQDKPDLAKKCYENMITANPDSARAYLRRAAFRRAHGQFDAAQEDCARAAAKDPQSVLPGLVEAGILAAKGAGEEAVARAEPLLARAPAGDGQVLYAAACVWGLAARAVAAGSDRKRGAELATRYADRVAALLQECMDKGFHDLIYPEHNRMAEDPAFEAVRGNPRVSALLAHRR